MGCRSYAGYSGLLEKGGVLPAPKWTQIFRCGSQANPEKLAGLEVPGGVEVKFPLKLRLFFNIMSSCLPAIKTKNASKIRM